MILRIDGIECCYDSVPVLKGISLEVQKGDFVGIVGPNGSGKTTLLRAIGGTLKLRKGAVLFEGGDIQNMNVSDLAKKMAAVQQDNSILFDFTAFDIVMMGRNPHLDRFRFETEKDVQVVSNAMKLTGSMEFADRPIGSLSAGEKQRVAIAKALAQEPSVMLLDEPTSHLDINFQLETLDLLRKLTSSGLTVVAAFHDLNLTARYCRNLIILKDGRILAAGKTGEVLTADNIRSAYNVDAEIKYHPVTKSLYIVPISPANGKAKELLE